jgi:DNA (cytosine-5)-methyltransferase 1
VCAVEWTPYCQQVLAQRQEDGLLPWFPIFGDVQQFDGKPWRGIVDVVSGGFPCTDISVAGKGAGITGKQSGMWTHMARIVGEVRPRYVFVENSPALVTRGLGVVLGDLAALGYDCRWTVLGAADVGAPHQRDRFWLVAHTVRYGQQQQEAGPEHSCHRIWPAEAHSPERGEVADAVVSSGSDVAHANGLRELQPQGGERSEWGWSCNRREDVAETNSPQRQGNERTQRIGTQYADIGGAGWWITEPDVDRVVNGVAARVDRLKAIGNGQVSAVAALAWKLLTKEQ